MTKTPKRKGESLLIECGKSTLSRHKGNLYIGGRKATSLSKAELNRAADQLMRWRGTKFTQLCKEELPYFNHQQEMLRESNMTPHEENRAKLRCLINPALQEVGVSLHTLPLLKVRKLSAIRARLMPGGVSKLRLNWQDMQHYRFWRSTLGLDPALTSALALSTRQQHEAMWNFSGGAHKMPSWDKLLDLRLKLRILSSLWGNQHNFGQMLLKTPMSLSELLNLATDTCSMLTQVGEHAGEVQLEFRSLQELHDQLTRVINDSNFNDIRQLPVLHGKPLELEVGEVSFIRATTAQQLIEAGNKLHICVGAEQYRDRAIKGEIQIILAYVRGELKACLEVEQGKTMQYKLTHDDRAKTEIPYAVIEQGKIIQFKLAYNERPQKGSQLLEAGIRYAVEFNMTPGHDLAEGWELYYELKKFTEESKLTPAKNATSPAATTRQSA